MELSAVMTDGINERTIEACQRGDPDAFRDLFETYKDRVYSIALYFFDGDEATAQDITQQVFLKLMTRVQQFENRSQFSTWLYRLVTNECLDRKRALRRELGGRTPEFPNCGIPVCDPLIQHEVEASVRAAVGGLKPKLRIAILLKYFEDLSYEEIAQVLGCSRGTVASRLNRGHRILARKLAHLRAALASGE